MPATIEDLEAAIQDTVSQANSVYLLNHNILEEYESRQKKIEELSKKQELDEKQLSRQMDEINALKGSWLPTLKNLVAQINETFSNNFREMAVAGEVSLDEHDMDYDKYGILIKVKFSRVAPRRPGLHGSNTEAASPHMGIWLYTSYLPNPSHIPQW
ncbi:structural maintenance of chromosomes 5 [Actinidia rufa]|uniref:Structural maintenance of chromosomes protein 5 n=1 Tax=Actinidia rufa TaxID=165716 RepID=A0A7J0EVT5_9ERIC|nr:structural maintenance of chromosomes 5 [Actinidia rufa]